MFFCECLNIVGKISESDGTAGRSILRFGGASNMNDLANYQAYEFLKSALGPVKGSVQIQHVALVKQRKVDKWTFNHCINCDHYVFATGEDVMLVNANLMRDDAQFIKMSNCDKYSMPFKIILKPIDPLPKAHGASDNPRVKAVFEKLQDFIEHDAIQTEAEIRRLTAEKNQRRQLAERDFGRILSIIESSDSAVASTKTLSSENIELTPPVTPESASDNMMIIESQLPQALKGNNKMKQRDGFAKHTNAFFHQQPITRAIDFEDDIFEIEVKNENEANETDHYHKFSDTEDGSDSEPALEKRPINRGRSGSINIARSAPISMPQFHHHLIHAIDDEKVDDQPMDIASSIQMLARSIQVDSVFGELPTRPVPRYNTDF